MVRERSATARVTACRSTTWHRWRQPGERGSGLLHLPPCAPVRTVAIAVRVLVSWPLVQPLEEQTTDRSSCKRRMDVNGTDLIAEEGAETRESASLLRHEYPTLYR